MHLQIQLHITHFLKIFLKKYARSAALLNYIIHFVINFKKCWKYISCPLQIYPHGRTTYHPLRGGYNHCRCIFYKIYFYERSLKNQNFKVDLWN